MEQKKEISYGKKDGIVMYLFVGVGYLLFCSIFPQLTAVWMGNFLPVPVKDSTAVLSLIAGLLYVSILYQRFGEKIELMENVSLSGVVVAFFLGILMSAVVNFILSPLLGSIFQQSEMNYNQSVDQLFQAPVAAFIQLVITAPLMEELIFRGFLLKRSLRWRGRLFSAFLIAAVFGILHLSLIQGISAMAAGVVLCLIYEWKQSVFLCILTHGIFNGLSFLMIMLVGR